MPDKPVIQYLNTDLDLICDIDPTPLVAELDALDLYADIVQTPHDGTGLWHVLCEDNSDTTEPERNVIGLLDAVDLLTEVAFAIWERCTKREFNVGYDCGDGPWAFNQGLSNDTLRRMAACGATFRVTLYPFRHERRKTTSNS